MAVVFPLNLPVVPGLKTFRMTASRVSGSVESPFTRQEQVQNFPGRLWEAELTLPPMRRAQAEEWLGFLLSLDGRAGTFLLGDPDATAPRGSVDGAPQIFGSGQTGRSLITSGWTPDALGVLRRGDYFQLGSGTATRLYKVVSDIDADPAGQATVEIWPNLRESSTNGEPLVTNAPKGTFRLATGEVLWSTDELAFYGVTFGAREAI